MTGAALVLSLVDTNTKQLHLVPVEAVPLHRRSGRYPALCGVDVLTANRTTAPARNCRDCVTRAERGGERLQPEPVRLRRLLLRWTRRAPRHGDRHG
jgi:hypothetical protein